MKEMDKINEMETLAKIRTLLALERNYLAEERTALAEFRTGLALAVIGPTISTIIAYIISFFEVEPSIVLDIMNVIFFSIVTIIGLWISYKSRIEFKKTRQKKTRVKKRIFEVSRSSKEIHSILTD